MQMAETKPKPLEEQIFELSREMLALDTGPLAELRRIEPDSAGPTAYWRLASRCGFLDADHERWMRIIKIMAILTPKGERDSGGVKDKLHQVKYIHEGREIWRGLGAAFCDGGDPGWKPHSFEEPDGVIPQKRLARFLAMPADQRHEALERTARTIARTRQRDCGVNCADIARLVLWPDDTRTPKYIAQAYYQRLDSAARSAENKEKSV